MSSIQAKMAARVSALGDKVDEAMAKASSNLGDARDQLGLGSSSRSKSTVSDLFPDEKPVRSTVNDLFPDEKPVKAVQQGWSALSNKLIAGLHRVYTGDDSKGRLAGRDDFSLNRNFNDIVR